MKRCKDCSGRLWFWRHQSRNPDLCRRCERWYDESLDSLPPKCKEKEYEHDNW